MRITDVLELLTSQHAEIDELLESLPLVTGRERDSLVGVLADRVATHLTAEADLFYPLIADLAPVDELLAEHAEIKAVTAKLLLGSERADALIVELAELMHGHTCWQEDELFVRVAEAMPLDVLARVGEQVGAWSESAICIAA